MPEPPSPAAEATSPCAKRCRSVNLHGRRCPRPATNARGLCSDHQLRRYTYRHSHVPAITPELPLLTYCEPRDCADMLGTLNLVVMAVAGGALAPSQSIQRTALLRTCNRSLCRMSQLRALTAALAAAQP